jgi:hypothetical protein
MGDNIDWVSWVLENTLNGVNKLTMISIMVQNKVPEDDAIALVTNISALPAYKISKKLMSRYKKLASVMGTLLTAQQHSPRRTSIEKIDMPDRETFLDKYWSASQPMVIKNFAHDWPAMQKWDLDYFETNFGDEEVEIQTGRETDPDFELNSSIHKTKVKLKEYIALIKDNPISNDYYMTANNHTLKNNKFKKILEDAGSLPDYATNFTSDGNTHLWIGPQGTVTPLHHDETAIFHLQIKGRKHWKLISPLAAPNLYNHINVFSPVDLENIDYEKYPLMKKVSVMEVTVEEGEAIFLPVGWWHNVVSKDVCISLSFCGFIFPNTWNFINPKETMYP